MVYVLIKNLPELLAGNDPQQAINEAVSKVKPKLVFDSFASARTYIDNEFKLMSPDYRAKYSYGFVELDVKHKDDFKIIQSQPEHLEKALSAFIVKEKRMNAQWLDIKEHEKQQLMDMKYQAFKSEELLLKEPYLRVLSRMPASLRFLCFIDYALFHHFNETWTAYHQREPGSVRDLFNAHAQLCQRLFLDGQSEPLTLKYIQALQSALSQNLFAKEVTSRSGALREGHNSFPILRDAVSLKGLIELLKRIRNDNNDDGFMIGELKQLDVMSQFYTAMSDALRVFYLQTKTPLSFTAYSKVFIELKERVVKDTVKAITRQHPHVSESVIREVILSEWQTNRIEDGCLNEEKYKKHGLSLFDSTSFHLLHLASQTKVRPSQSELKMELALARQHALVNPGVVAKKTDEELESMAKTLMAELSRQPLSILTPEAKTAVSLAQKAIEQYNKDLINVRTPDEAIRCIVSLVHELELLHLFHDANCRTNYFLLNEALLKLGLKATMLYNPNRLDLYSVAELEEQVKQGMHRFDYVIAEASELGEMNADWLGKKSSAELYENLSTKLNNVIAEFTQRYEAHLKKLEKMLEQSASDQRLFSTHINNTLLIQIKKLFEQFKGDGHLLQLTSALQVMDKKEMEYTLGKEFLSELDSLLALTRLDTGFFQELTASYSNLLT
ncbi:hypothetical protein DIZ81_10840 [Legionella taurinensis]|uniref:Fido domain-containing protein n=1 Tax=Legionella taurinensis TaxID=70611 RepID=A0A3A5L3V7_9GAMM|nr:hypothetical protein [Legionella taurinensis]MDX1838345.1 hypothetical protein [Legionella taurinensis]PUT39107.1 hypothetical protein DB744_10850 [Legionella taurinensis]PUT39561.1 hypothetical protein DB746_13505 [Legionella taurinensis]PUT43563.1 hypothetical protein DB743_10240 [Legionella taurinensis]PUT45217.1 hypothetical protein DB745_13445 [Legionella taurinensis]